MDNPVCHMSDSGAVLDTVRQGVFNEWSIHESIHKSIHENHEKDCLTRQCQRRMKLCGVLALSIFQHVERTRGGVERGVEVYSEVAHDDRGVSCAAFGNQSPSSKWRPCDFFLVDARKPSERRERERERVRCLLSSLPFSQRSTSHSPCIFASSQVWSQWSPWTAF